MGRVINSETAGKERTRLAKAVVLALRELMHQTEPDEVTRDLAAFIALALDEISESIEASVGAWEKRGYWVKADRYRMEWDWSGRLAKTMRNAILEGDWAGVAMSAAQVAEKLQDIKIPQKHRLGTPWIGAWNQLRMASK